MRITLVCLLLMFSTMPALSADLTGKWTGSAEFVGEDGQTQSRSVIFNFKQEGTAVTGNAGYDENLVAPISDGKLEGAKLTLTVAADFEYKIEMNMVSDDQLEGVAKFTPSGAPEMSAKLKLSKVQPK